MAKMEKFLALVLALTMTLSLMGITVLADEGSPDEATIAADLDAKLLEFQEQYLMKNLTKPQNGIDTSGNSDNIAKALNLFSDFKALYEIYNSLSLDGQKKVSNWKKIVTPSALQGGNTLLNRLSVFFKSPNDWQGNGQYYVIVVFQKPDGNYISELNKKVDSLSVTDLQEESYTIKETTYVFENAYIYGGDTITDSVDVSGATDQTIPVLVVVGMKVQGAEVSANVQAFLDTVKALNDAPKATQELLDACATAYDALNEDERADPSVVAALKIYEDAKKAYDEAQQTPEPEEPKEPSDQVKAYLAAVEALKDGEVTDEELAACEAAYNLLSDEEKLLQEVVEAKAIYDKAKEAQGTDQPVDPEPAPKPATDQTGDGWSFTADGTLTITSSTGFSFYTSLTANVDPQFVKNVVVNFETTTDVTSNNWSGLIKLPVLESLTIKNAGRAVGPNEALTSTVFNSLTYKDCTTIDKHDKLTFAEGGKVTIHNCTTIKEYAFCIDSFYSYSKPIPNLTDVEIEDVKTIETGAFCADQLKKLHIAFTKADLGAVIKAFAFYKNAALEELYLDVTGCKEIVTMAFDKTGTPNTKVMLVGFDPSKTKVGISSLFDDLADGNPFNKKIDIVGLLDGYFEMRQLKDRQTLGEREEYTSSKVGTDGDTQVTKSAKWTNDERTEAEVAFEFTYDEKPGRDYLFLMDISKSIGDTASGYEHSRLLNFQSKVIDVADVLLSANNYDNRVGIVTFASAASSMATFDFVGAGHSQEVTNYVLGIKRPVNDDSTSYKEIFAKALEVINNRSDKSREVEIIFLSDGQVGFKNDYQNELNALKETGANVYVVVAGTAKASGNNLTSLLGIASKAENVSFETFEGGYLYYEATNTNGFSAAMNAAVDASFTEYVLTDNVDPRFTVTAEDINVVDNGTAEIIENADGTQTIIWHIYGIPFEVYNLSYTATLKSDDTYGNITTNAGDATIKDVDVEEQANAVASPELDRPAPYVPGPTTYSVTVNYVDDQGNTIQASASTGGYYYGSSYTVAVPEIEGYTFDHAEGATSGTINGNVTVTLVYTANPELPDEDVPQTDTPETPEEPETPETPEIPDEEPPLAELPDEDTPTAELPEQEEPATEIPEENVPLDESPKTGDGNAVAVLACLAFCSGCGLVALGFSGKKKHD